MSKKKHENDIFKILENGIAKRLSSKEESLRQLIKAGILDKSSNYTEPYQALCTQPRQG